TGPRARARRRRGEARPPPTAAEAPRGRRQRQRRSSANAPPARARRVRCRRRETSAEVPRRDVPTSSSKRDPTPRRVSPGCDAPPSDSRRRGARPRAAKRRRPGSAVRRPWLLCAARRGAGTAAHPAAGRLQMTEVVDDELAELLAEVRRIEVQSSRLATGALAGGYTSVFRGAGIEFEEMREYAEGDDPRTVDRSEEHTSELQSRENLVCRLLLEKKKRHYHPP